jgi:hypothetical protein
MSHEGIAANRKPPCAAPAPVVAKPKPNTQHTEVGVPLGSNTERRAGEPGGGWRLMRRCN